MAPVRKDIAGKRITVLGAGRSGLAVTRLLAGNGASVFLSEQRREGVMDETAEILRLVGVGAEFGGHSPRALDADWIAVSPGIPLTAPLLREADARGIPVYGELEVASWFSRAPVVAVTGSNGKSTTTALIGEMFRAAGRTVLVAGNIGSPFSEGVESLPADGVAVLEVSSFQLETVRTFHPAVALYLNLTQDHLNRHGSIDRYAKLKARIFENQTESDFLVLNGLDATVCRLADGAKSRKGYFAVDRRGSPCAFVRDGRLVLRVESEEILLPASDVGIRGDHNIQNALAAALACRWAGVRIEALARALRSFPGLPHRLEFVRNLNGVEYVNDSKGTNVDSVWYALGSFDRPIVLIAGGRDKDQDFTALRERVGERTRAAVLIGEAAEKLASALAGVRPVVFAASLKEAVDKARHLAKPGDVVLLSPACASFDMFQNYEDRGDRFKTIVHGLP